MVTPGTTYEEKATLGRFLYSAIPKRATVPVRGVVGLVYKVHPVRSVNGVGLGRDCQSRDDTGTGTETERDVTSTVLVSPGPSQTTTRPVSQLGV